jgi:hypothetical protein
MNRRRDPAGQRSAPGRLCDGHHRRGPIHTMLFERFVNGTVACGFSTWTTASNAGQEVNRLPFGKIWRDHSPDHIQHAARLGRRSGFRRVLRVPYDDVEGGQAVPGELNISIERAHRTIQEPPHDMRRRRERHKRIIDWHDGLGIAQNTSTHAWHRHIARPVVNTCPSVKTGTSSHPVHHDRGRKARLQRTTCSAAN